MDRSSKLNCQEAQTVINKHQLSGLLPGCEERRGREGGTGKERGRTEANTVHYEVVL